jgi:DNA-directed RNA polymerase specialized sigma24 family protein
VVVGGWDRIGEWLDRYHHESDTAEVVVLRSEATEAMWQLACLPNPMRDVFARHALNDESLARIAAEYGKPADWAYYLRREAARRLTAALTPP